MTLHGTNPEQEGSRELLECIDRVAGDARSLAPASTSAFKLLEPNVMGGTRHLYSEAALDAYLALNRADPADPDLLHHLAIMHHSRAFDLELGATPSQANDDWERAMAYWRQLWEHAAFWEHQERELSGYEQGVEAVRRVRQSLPEKLMRIHTDIALDEFTRPQRARFHVRMLRQAPFDPAIRQSLLGEVYDRFMRGVPREVWSDDTTELPLLRNALDAVEQYLEIDPDSLTALSDALRLQVRMLIGWYQEWGALPEQDVQGRVRWLETIRSSAEHWTSALERLLSRAHELPPRERDDLALWFRVVADVARESGRLQTAIDNYHRALQAGGSNPDEQHRCREGLYLARALLVRDKASAEHAGAREECIELVRASPRSIGTRYVLANALLLLEELDAAESVCQDALAEEDADSDMPRAERRPPLEKLNEMLKSVRQARTRASLEPEVEAANVAIGRGDWADAVSRLNRVLEACPGDVSCLVLRFRANLKLLDLRAARSDLAECRARLGDQAASHLATLAEDCDRAERKSQALGLEAARLQSRAYAAQTAGRLPDAEKLLRAALKGCLAAGRKEVESELAVLIWNQTVPALGGVLEDPNTTAADRLAACQAARNRLEEVVKLEPRPDFVRELDTVDKLIRQLGGQCAAEAQHAELVREFGSQQALALHEAAWAEWKSNRHSEALRTMRAAHRAGHGSSRLCRELADVLRRVAVHLVNHRAGDDPETLRLARDHLKEAAGLDPESQAIQSDLATVQRLLRGTASPAWRKT